MIPRISLKHILSADAIKVLDALVETIHADIGIVDATQKTLYGNIPSPSTNLVSISYNDVVIGSVQGNKHVELVADLIQNWVNREGDKKKLGNEVLMLYQEVNQIFNFSEKLAETIGQQSIAAITLQEASRLIKSDSAMIVLWDEASQKLNVIAASGKPLFDQAKLDSHRELLLHIAKEGQSDILDNIGPLKATGLVCEDIHAIVYASLKVKHRIMGAIILGNSIPIQYSAADLKFLVTIALQSASSIESALLYEQNIREAKEREEAMRSVYEVANKFVPHEFIRSLGREVITDVQLGDQAEKIVTVLFSDIRGYTTLAEKMTPEENFQFVCSFNERIGPIIRKNNGFINQYLGDAIMAIFPGNPADALRAAIDMHAAVQALNQERILNNEIPIRIGVGMYTGPLIMGITGDHERLDATTISDTVNTASRLEGLTKHYKVSILLGKSSVDQLENSGDFQLRYLGDVQLKGKMEAVSIYECFNDASQEAVALKKETHSLFQQAIQNYHHRNFEQALSQFQNVLDKDPDDHSARKFLDKVTACLLYGVKEDWTGVDEMHVK